jgi:hypothetical protein
MISGVLTGTLELRSHRGAFGEAIGPGPWDDMLRDVPGADLPPGTSPAVLSRLGAIPLTLPDDIDDLLEAVAPLHRPEASDHGRPVAGPWWKGGIKGATSAWAGLRRSLRDRRGTPAPWRTPVEGAQASAAASEAERVAFGSSGLSLGTVAALSQLAQAEAPKAGEDKPALHVPQPEMPAEAAAHVVITGHGTSLDATYGMQPLATGTTIIPTTFTILGGTAGTSLAPAVLGDATLPMAAALAVPKAPSPPAVPEFLSAQPWAPPRGEAAMAPETHRAAEPARQPDRGAVEPVVSGPTSPALPPTTEKPAQTSRSLHRDEEATGTSTASPARPETVLTSFRADPAPSRPTWQEEQARHERDLAAPTDRGFAPDLLATAGAGRRNQRQDPDENGTGRGDTATATVQPDREATTGSGDGPAKSAVAVVPPVPTEAGSDGHGANPQQKASILPAALQQGQEKLPTEAKAASSPGRTGEAAAGISPSDHASDPLKGSPGSAQLTDNLAGSPGDKAASLAGGAAALPSAGKAAVQEAGVAVPALGSAPGPALAGATGKSTEPTPADKVADLKSSPAGIPLDPSLAGDPGKAIDLPPAAKAVVQDNGSAGQAPGPSLAGTPGKSTETLPVAKVLDVEPASAGKPLDPASLAGISGKAADLPPAGTAAGPEPAPAGKLPAAEKIADLKPSPAGIPLDPSLAGDPGKAADLPPPARAVPQDPGPAATPPDPSLAGSASQIGRPPTTDKAVGQDNGPADHAHGPAIAGLPGSLAIPDLNPAGQPQDPGRLPSAEAIPAPTPVDPIPAPEAHATVPGLTQPPATPSVPAQAPIGSATEPATTAEPNLPGTQPPSQRQPQAQEVREPSGQAIQPQADLTAGPGRPAGGPAEAGPPALDPQGKVASPPGLEPASVSPDTPPPPPADPVLEKILAALGPARQDGLPGLDGGTLPPEPDLLAHPAVDAPLLLNGMPPLPHDLPLL